MIAGAINLIEHNGSVISNQRLIAEICFHHEFCSAAMIINESTGMVNYIMSWALSTVREYARWSAIRTFQLTLVRLRDLFLTQHLG